MRSHMAPRVWKASEPILSITCQYTQCPLAASPLVECKEVLLNGIWSALTQTDMSSKKSAILVFSSLLFVPQLLTDSEVSWCY